MDFLNLTLGSYWFCWGTEFRAIYRGHTYLARVEAGQFLHADGNVSKSLSAAAKHITGKQTNGVHFWEYKSPGYQNWIPVRTIRSHRKSGE